MNVELPPKSIRYFITVVVILCFHVGLGKGQNHKPDGPTTPSEAVILEIMEQWSGMVPYGRKWVYFRLYDGGRAVYQDLKKSEENSRLEPVRREIALQQEDYQELLRLLESPDFLNARDAYPKLWQGTDAVYTTTIWYKRQKHSKQIMMINYTDAHAKSKAYYPKSLIALMQLIEAIRKRESK